MNKGVTITLITLLSLLTISLIIGLIILLKGNFSFNNFNFDITNSMSETLVDEKEIYSIKDIDLKVDVADIIVQDEDRETIKIELYSDYVKKYEITEEENKLKVVFEQKSKISFNLFKKTPYVKVYVPKNYNSNILVDSNVGDLKIKNLKYASLNAKANVGDIKVKEIDNAIVNVNTGDVKIEKVNRLTSDMGTGDLKIISVNELVSKNKTGDVKINSVNGFVNITSTTGDIKIETANITKNSKITSNTGDVKIMNTTGCYVEGKTNVGDNNINNNDRKSNVELIINNNIGDIKVNN